MHLPYNWRFWLGAVGLDFAIMVLEVFAYPYLQSSLSTTWVHVMYVVGVVGLLSVVVWCWYKFCIRRKWYRAQPPNNWWRSDWE